MNAAKRILLANKVTPKRTAAAIVKQLEELQGTLYPLPTQTAEQPTMREGAD
jgi:hypothetical protein